MNKGISAPTAESVAARLEVLGTAPGIRSEVIGHSREGRSLFGVNAGSGPLRVSITAGAHSDEPGGPLAVLALLEELASEAGQRRLAWTTWRVCPQINPDGAARNASWFADPPDLLRYGQGAFREPPGEDMEFNYPSQMPGAPAARLENRRVAAFLSAGGPVDLHLSLHGMAFAEGAWWLIGKEWVERTAELRGEMAQHFEAVGLGLHDWDRRGEKGFTRIEPGFCTTPTSAAMRAFFEAQGQPEMAAKFLPSSMEFMQSLGGDPLVMVSEMPLFRIGRRSPSLAESSLARLRERLPEAQRRLAVGDVAGAHQLIEEFQITPVAFATQIAAILGAIRLAERFLLRQRGLANAPGRADDVGSQTRGGPR